MGISKSAYRIFLEEKKKGILKGESILQLGRQAISFDYQTLCKYGQKHNVTLSSVDPQLSFDPHYRALGAIDDRTFFKSLGFKKIHSMDYSDYEGADIVWDLNEPVPEEYWNRFDVIYDGGTAEHVFHFPQVLKNIHLMLKTDGIVIHDLPSNNHVDHGFYMYSPRIYSEYYMANQYSILSSQLIEYSRVPGKPFDIYSYCPGALDKLNYGDFGRKMVLIHFVAQKQAASTAGVIPQQGSYVHAWEVSSINASQANNVPQPPPRKRSLISRWRRSLKKKYSACTPYPIKRYFAKKRLDKVAKY